MKNMPELSEIGLKLFDSARKDTREEIKQFKRLRTRFYYPVEKGQIDSIELRTMIDNILDEFKISIEGLDRNSKYFHVIHTRIFDILDMKIHRLSPDHYLVATRKADGPIVFIIRDKKSSPNVNIKLTWESERLETAEQESIPFHAIRESLDLE